MQHTIHQEAQQQSQGDRAGQFTLSFLQGVDRRRTEIACGTWLIQALCGSNLIPWAVELFKKAGLSEKDAFSINIGVPAGGLLGTLASWYRMRKLGRRTLYLGGGLVMAILLTFAASLSFLPNQNTAGWGAGITLIVYFLVYDLTVGPVC
jgi:MFS transporter, SP family, general alpha glucoside:H+ symporter